MIEPLGKDDVEVNYLIENTLKGIDEEMQTKNKKPQKRKKTQKGGPKKKKENSFNSS